MLRPIKKQIESLQFTLFSPEEIKKVSKAKIITPELYDVDGVKQIDQGVGIKIFGGWSRANDQKSLSLFARKEYGMEKGLTVIDDRTLYRKQE